MALAHSLYWEPACPGMPLQAMNALVTPLRAQVSVPSPEGSKLSAAKDALAVSSSSSALEGEPISSSGFSTTQRR